MLKFKPLIALAGLMLPIGILATLIPLNTWMPKAGRTTAPSPMVTWPRDTQKQLVYTAPAGSAENRFTLRLNAAVLELHNDQNGSLLCSQRLDLTSSVAIKGADGNTDDTLTLDFDGGMFSVPLGISYDGGAGGFDTLALRGGKFDNQLYDMRSPSDGVVTLDNTRVIFSNLEPMDDTSAAASLIINGTAGADPIMVSDGGLVNGFQTTRVSSGGTFEEVRFANKTSVVVNGMAGVDAVTLNNPNPAAGLVTLELSNVETISQSGALKVPRFSFMMSSGSVTLNNSANDVDVLSGSNNSGTLSFSDMDDLTVGALTFDGLAVNGNITLTTGGLLTLEKKLSAGGVLTLNAGGPVTQAERLQGISGLRLLGSGPFQLNHPENTTPVFAASTDGAISFTNNNTPGMTIGNVAGTRGVVSNNHSVSITVKGPLTVTNTRPGAADVDAGTGQVSLIAGRAGQDDALTIGPDADVIGRGGDLLLRADHLAIGALIDATSSTIKVEPFEPGTLIDLGGPDTPNSLGLTAVEINFLTANQIRVSSNATGTMTITSPISTANTPALFLESVSGFSATGSGSLSGQFIGLVDSGAVARIWGVTPTSVKVGEGNPIPYSAVTQLGVGLGSDSDIVNLTPSSNTSFTVVGGDPGPPATPGDTLNVNLAGTTDPFLSLISLGNGSYQFTNRQHVTFIGIETLPNPLDLSITKTDGQNLTQPGANLTYLIIAKNNGPLGLKNVPVTDILPSSLTSQGWTCFASPGSNCASSSGNGNINQSVSLAAGGTVTYNFSANVASSTSGTIMNTAIVGLPPGVNDPTPGNNSASDNTSIPTLTIDDVTVAEGSSGSTNAVFTVTLSPSLQTTVTVDYFTANGSATEPTDYTAVSGPLTFSPGQTTRNITVPVNGDTLIEGDESFFVNLMNPTGAVIGDTQGIGTITEDDTSGTLQLSASANPVPENGGKVTITITRTGNTSLPVSVDFGTADITATQKNDYSIQLSTFTFGAGETTKSIDIFITDDAFLEGNESFNVLLTNPTNNFVAGAPNPLTITITDNDVAPGPNPINDATFFVRQNYIDFLNREPDPSGLAFWTGEITSCGLNIQCIEVKRINVSAAFYLSIEFQETGGFAIRINRAAFAKKSDTASTRLSYQQFIRDSHKIGQDVVVGVGNWQQQLEENKDAYARQIATSAQFIAQYPLAQTADQFVDALFASAMVVPTTIERQAAIDAFGGGGGIGRVAALRSVADSTSVRNVEFRPSFVLLEYSGYLRRAPTDPPDADDSGYQFWLTKLNQFNGNFVQAEMVKAFITSGEYRSRFGP
jgi:uncharacterized repeat protein (TIGR01451 family)